MGGEKKYNRSPNNLSQYTRSLIEASLDPLVTISPVGIITDVNEATVKVTGVTREDLIGTDFSDYFTEPDKARAGYRTVFEKGYVTDYPLTIKHISGKLTPVLYNASVYKDSLGDELGVFAAARDITERLHAEEELKKYQEKLEKIVEERTAELKRLNKKLKDSEKKYRNMIQTTSEGIWVSDRQWKTMFVNKRMAEMLGYSLKELMRSDMLSVVTPDSRDKILIQRKLREQGISDVFEIRLRRKDEIDFWALVSSKAITDEKGQFTQCLAMITDITDLKRMDQLKDEFLGMVSHEMRTPLTVIIGGLDTVLTENVRISYDDMQSLLKDSLMEAERLANILENLLELSRLQANRLFLHNEPVNIPKLVYDVVDHVKKGATHKLICDFPAKMPVIDADPLRIERILNNLIQNAIKYSPLGSEIRIFAKKDKTGIIIGVKDEGIGISLESQAKLFNPFQRLETGPDEIKGVGLGLSVCKRLVEAHHGRIWLESEPNIGSTFFFSLPFNKSSQSTN